MISAVKTLYTVLGIEATAAAEDIEDAFLRLKARYPKSKTDADEQARLQFQAIEQAYRTLSDPDARAVYDQRLARTGMRVARGPSEASGGWLSTRNIVVAGVIVLIGSGMWWYHARERARAEKEIAERAMQLIEEEKRRDAGLREQEEARRQARFENEQNRREELRQQQFNREVQNTARQAESDRRRAQYEADNAARREQAERDRQARQQDAARRQSEHEARQRLEAEKRHLREVCMQRYGRPDC